jgi:hypothetical protein
MPVLLFAIIFLFFVYIVFIKRVLDIFWVHVVKIIVIYIPGSFRNWYDYLLSHVFFVHRILRSRDFKLRVFSEV